MDQRTGPGIVPVANETTSSLTRLTKGGKQYRYDLCIIQQPERARACGSGAKASADRRPVDPPPILRLQIAEILPNGEEHDVTFVMHAQYFLFATLERARVLAPARNHQEPKIMDCLTGTNVTGMQPFDRPHPAIYFIFPDLSVRHEGKYRLSFSLYEDTRRAEDVDRHDMTDMLNNETHHSVVHRMEVKSTIFDVFSAKRFPGLTESTELSRTFAEQGSRIRIRRDVRMRRNPKSGKDWEGYEDDRTLGRPSHTPDPFSAHASMQRAPLEPMQRPRSSGGQPLMQPVSRRTSLNDLNYQQMPQQSGFSYPNAFAQPSAQSYVQASHLHPPPQMPAASYQQAVPAAPSQQSSFFYNAPQASMSQLQYPPISTTFDNNAYQRSSADLSTFSADSRRASVQSMQPMLNSAGSQSSFTGFPRQQNMHIDSHPQGHAPPEPVQPPTRVQTPNPPALPAKASFTTQLPPLSTTFSHKMDVTSPSSAAPSNYANSLPTPSDSHKRPYGSSFPTNWQNTSNKQGSRPLDPISAGMFLAADTDGDDTADIGEFTNNMRMYRRAGGQTVERQMP